MADQPRRRRLVRVGTSAYSGLVARQVREMRKAQGLTVEELAARAKERGLVEISASLITDIELGRKQTVSVDHWLYLAAALDVAPVHLLIPLDSREECGLGEDRTYSAGSLRRWLQGAMPLDFTNSRAYFTQVPEEDWAAFSEQAIAKAQSDIHPRATPDPVQSQDTPADEPPPPARRRPTRSTKKESKDAP